MQISHASDFVFHNMKGGCDCSKHFLPSIFEMSTSLRPTVKFSWQWKGPYLPNHYNLMPSLQKIWRKRLFFLSKLYRFTFPSASASAQTPVVLISATESGNYWPFLFMPQARSKLRHPHTLTQAMPFSFFFSTPLPNHNLLFPAKSHHQNPHRPPALVLDQQKLEVSPESGVQ